MGIRSIFVHPSSVLQPGQVFNTSTNRWSSRLFHLQLAHSSLIDLEMASIILISPASLDAAFLSRFYSLPMLLLDTMRAVFDRLAYGALTVEGQELFKLKA